MHNTTCCTCQPILCGQHIIKPCQVLALKQVRSQTNSEDLLFVAIMAGTEERSLFMTFRDVEPLLELWDIKPEEIHKIGAMPPQVRERHNRRVRAERGVQRAQKKLQDVKNDTN